MAADIEKKLGVKAELIAGSGGIFDVEADGKMVYSKHDKGRFPEHDEVLSGLAEIG